MKNRRAFLKSVGLATVTAATAPAMSVSTIKAKETRARHANVLIIVSDEHQANTCGCYGSKVRQVDGRSPTPHIDDLASKGIRFDSMYCPSPLCAPSRAAYMTGCYPHTTTALYHKMQRRGAGFSRLPGVRENIQGMGKYFRDAGYRTAAFGKMHVHGEEAKGWDLGFDERDLRLYTQAPGMQYADLRNGDLNQRYREIPPYMEMNYKEIDPHRFAQASESLKVNQNGVNQHFLETLVEHEDEMFDHLTTELSIEFIERKILANEPFMVHVGLEKPHRPWTVHRKFLDRFNPADIPLPDTIAEWIEKGMHPFVQGWSHSSINGDEARNSTAAYYGCASQVDDCVGRIISKCKSLGILDNTIVVYTSDHGENLYEHGLIEKHNMLDPSCRVPFVISAPWLLPQGSVCESPANLIDLIPTLLELTNLEKSSALEGKSLISAIHGKEDPERMIFSEFYESGSCTRKNEFLPVRMGLKQDYKYIYTHAAADQLYDRRTDGEESSHNLAFDPDHESLVSHMKLCTLDRWELDEYPQLEANVIVTEKGVGLSWEPASTNARYGIYRSTTEDPREAERIISGLAECSWMDSSPLASGRYFYWVLGQYFLDQPFIDDRGKSRYGDSPILSTEYPRSLPVTRRIEVRTEQGYNKSFSYKPLHGSVFCGSSWIYIGKPPVSDGEGARLTGPVTVLSPKPIEGDISLSAKLRTLRPGPNPTDTLQLLFHYQNMNNYYSVCIRRDGSVGLWKRTGEWALDLLEENQNAGSNPIEWQQLKVTFQKGVISISLNGTAVLSAIDSAPFQGGRFGFDAPLHISEGQVQSVALL